MTDALSRCVDLLLRCDLSPLCSSLAVYISRYVDLSLCLSLAVFISRCVYLSLCLFLAVFISCCVDLSLRCVHLSLCLSQAICDITNNLWSILKAGVGTYGGYEAQGDADKDKSGQRLLFRQAGKIYGATISDQRKPDSKQPDKCQPDVRKYYLKYKKKAGSRGRVKAVGWVDMDLPTWSQCSWWRLGGYTTYDEATNDDDGEDSMELNDSSDLTD